MPDLPLDLAALGTYFEAQGYEVRTAHRRGDDDAIEIILPHRDIIYIDHYKHRWRITHRFNFIEVLIDPAEPNAIEQLEAELNRYQLLRMDNIDPWGKDALPLDLAALYSHLEAQGHALEIVLKWNAPVAFRVTKGTGLIYIERHDHLWRIFHWYNGPDHNTTHLIDPAEPNAIEQVEAEIAKRRP